MSEESVLAFRKLVSAMRTTEKEYWEHRDRKVLRQSIELEKRVDGIIMRADGKDVPQNENGTFFLEVAQLRADTITYFQEKKKPQPDKDKVRDLYDAIKKAEAKIDKMLVRFQDERLREVGYRIIYHVMERRKGASRSVYSNHDEQMAKIQLNDYYRHPDTSGALYFICKEYIGKDGKPLPQEEVDKIISNIPNPLRL